jgi:type II secretory pathway component GspD/PulD (secretin)
MKADKIQVWKNGLESIQPTLLETKEAQLKFKFTKGVNATVSKSIAGYRVSFATVTQVQPPKVVTNQASSVINLPATGWLSNLGVFAKKSIEVIGQIEATLESQDGTATVVLHASKPTPKQAPTKQAITKKSTAVVASKVTAPKLDTKAKIEKASETILAAANPLQNVDAMFVPLPDSRQDIGIDATPQPPKHAQTLDSMRHGQTRVIQGTAAHGFASTTTNDAPKAEAKPAPKIAPKSAPKGDDQRVSLDFVNTDVVHILKSLAMQTRVNIVTSPDVTGKLSVKLDGVTVREALNLVTALSGLRFSQVGKTYVVTTPAKFMETLRSVQGPKEDVTLSRVVPIFSGQGNQIKIAVLKSIPIENSYGRFEVVLPSEKTVISASQKVAGAAADEKDGTSMKSESASDPNVTDTYMMVIGSPGRIDEVEQLVKSMDRQLCLALGISMPKTTQTIIESYTVHGGRASELVEAVAGKGKTMIGSVEVFATPSNSIAKQTIVLKGREDEVRNVLRALEQLDSDESATMTEFQVVDLMYADPRSAREMIVASVPGISVTIAPNGVLNPAAYQQDQARIQSEQRGTDQPAPQGGGSQLANGNQNNAALQQGGQGGAQQGVGGQQLTAGKETADSGFTMPFSQFEAVGVPMRLVMKGSKEQIERAIGLLKVLDIAPKQVALEMRVMEISRDELLKLGVDWNMFTSGAVKTIRLNNPNTNPSNTIGVSLQGRDVSGDVSATLDSISTNSNLISRPNLLCNDGRGNEVFVGDAIRYIESIISSQNGPSVTTGVVRAGVRLAVLPRIGGDTINLDLQTMVTYLRGFKAVPQIGGELPQTSERLSSNSITLKDGETFAIGGLIQEQVRKELSGLPILKDLPILGQLFRRTTDQRIKTELVIFVTARIVGPGKDKSAALPMTPDTHLMAPPKTGSKPMGGKTRKGGL